MRMVLGEMPRHRLQKNRPMTAEEFFDVATSSYATKRDLRQIRGRRRAIAQLQKAYVELIKVAGADLQTLAERAALINRPDRITGDAIAAVEELVVRHRHKLGSGGLHRLIMAFVRDQILDPDCKPMRRPPLSEFEAKLLERMHALVWEYREGL
jgi:hypothetical protein